MKKFSKVLALGLAAAMLGGVFVGCSQEPATPAEEKPAVEKSAEEKTGEEKPVEEAAKPVTLRVVSQFGGTDPNAVTFENHIKKFQEANSHVTNMEIKRSYRLCSW